MATTEVIPISSLSFMLFPIVIVGYFFNRWVRDKKRIPIATGRMLLQLLSIGFFLNFIFTSKSQILLATLLAAMLAIAAIIAFNQTKNTLNIDYKTIFLSLCLGCLPVLGLVVFGVLNPKNGSTPRVVIPLAGMIFANAMTAISLALDRFASELSSGKNAVDARAQAFKASLIPIINAFLSVGLVSLPGMMTGQILAGVDPLIAVRYQIMVMCMVFGSSGLAVTALFILNSKEIDTIRK